MTSPASHNILDYFQDKAEPSGSSKKDRDEGERELILHVDYSRMNHQDVVQHKMHYWGYAVKPQTFAQQALLLDVPEPGLAMIGSSSKMLVNRFVRKNLQQVAQRKSVRQVLEERDRAELNAEGKPPVP